MQIHKVGQFMTLEGILTMDQKIDVSAYAIKHKMRFLGFPEYAPHT